MKEVKKFFNDDNKLNKGYTRGGGGRRLDNSLYKNKLEQALPSTDVMGEYEEMFPGTVDKLMEMALQEQNHRHKMEMNMIEQQHKASRLGRVFALVFIFLICVTTMLIAITGEPIVAAIFAGGGFLTIVLTSVFAYGNPKEKVHNEGKFNRGNHFKRR